MKMGTIGITAPRILPFMLLCTLAALWCISTCHSAPYDLAAYSENLRAYLRAPSRTTITQLYTAAEHENFAARELLQGIPQEKLITAAEHANSLTDAPLLMVLAARIYLYGPPQIRDKTRAFDFLHAAVAQKEPLAYLTLGILYDGEGLYLPQNDSKAMAMYRQAADLGNSAARGLLGLKYLTSSVGAQRLKQAAQHIQQAAQADDPFAQLLLSHLYSYGLGIAANPAASHHWYQKGRQHNDTQAFVRMADHYRNTPRFPRNIEKAFHYYTLAAHTNDPASQITLARLHFQYRNTRFGSQAAALFWQQQARKNGAKDTDAPPMHDHKAP
jgi:TPR repeat protein